MISIVILIMMLDLVEVMIVVVVVEVVVVQCGCRCGRIGLAVVVGVIHFVVDRSWTTRTELKTSKFYPVNVKWHFLMNFFFMPSVIPKFHFLCAILSCFKIRPTSPCATFLAVCDWRG